MNRKIKINCLIIILSRFVDLYSTRMAMVDFKSQETNVLVKFLNLTFFEFCFIDVLLASLLIILYLFSIRNLDSFKFKDSSLLSYSINFLYKKRSLNHLGYIFSMSLKRVLILVGSITPIYIFITSLIFSLNNFWVYLFIKNNSLAVNSYRFFNSLYFFDFIIYILPILILLVLLYSKLKNEYFLSNKYTL